MVVSKKGVCKGGVLLITALLLLALGLFLWFTALPVRSGATEVVEIDGDEVARYELSRQTEERIVEPVSYTHLLHSGRIWIAYSPSCLIIECIK